jgi:hypothetical protein
MGNDDPAQIQQNGAVLSRNSCLRIVEAPVNDDGSLEGGV